jgi:hypothetical protein
MRVCLGALVAGLLIAAAGCGGSDSAATGGSGAAAIAPKNAAVYATINTDLDSGQVNQLEELLAKFPDRDQLFAEIQKSLAEDDLSWEQDIKPALGDTLDVVLLDLDDGDFVVILKPADKAKFEALLDKSDEPSVSREVDGWTVASDSEATLDRFESARSGGSLEDNEQFEEAMGELPDEALAKLYVDGAAATSAAESAGAGDTGNNRLKAFAAALGAESGGIKLDGGVKTELEGDLASLEPYESKLIDAAPEGALLFLSGNGQGKLAENVKEIEQPNMLSRFRDLLGVDADELAGLFDGEFALWVAPGAPIPEVTVLGETSDEAAAKQTLDRLAAKLQATANGARRQTEIDGVQASQVVVDGFPITYASFDGRFIVTTRPGAIQDVRSGGGLADDEAFKQAADDTEMPDATFGFLYVNVEKLAELIQGFAGVAGEQVPPEVERNIDPLGAFLMHASGESEDMKISAFLSIE